MTVAQLKELLESFPQDSEVFVQLGAGFHEFDISEDEESGNVVIIPGRDWV